MGALSRDVLGVLEHDPIHVVADAHAEQRLVVRLLGMDRDPATDPRGGRCLIEVLALLREVGERARDDAGDQEDRDADCQRDGYSDSIL